MFQTIDESSQEVLALEFSTRILVFIADPIGDTLSVHSNVKTAVDTLAWTRLDARQPWKSLIGRPFGWGWITVNQHGECDGVILSFDDIFPTIMLYVVGAAIAVWRLVDWEESALSNEATS